MKKPIFFTPGPSQLYPTVEKHIKTAFEENIPSISHRSARFHEIFQSAIKRIRKLLGVPNSYAIFFLSSATEAMERIIQNTVEKKSFHFVNGSFSKKFYQIGIDLGKNSCAENLEMGEWCDIKNVRIIPDAELITFTQNETSTGVSIPIKDIESISVRHPKILIAVDIVSSVPYVNLPFEKLDCVFFSVQKGFGLPSGLGVLIVSPRAVEKANFLKNRGLSTGSYHSFDALYKQYQKYQTPETPNVLNIYLLEKITKDMLHKGIQNIRNETDEKAALLYDFIESRTDFSLFVNNSQIRSKTTIVISTPHGSQEIIQFAKNRGYILGSGYGEMKDRQIRIANFPAHNMKNLKKLLNIFNHL